MSYPFALLAAVSLMTLATLTPQSSRAAVGYNREVARSADQQVATLVTPPAPANWREGADYDVISPPQPAVSGKNGIEVIEFFAYWCPHCRTLEPLLEQWAKTAPHDAILIRIPVVWDQRRSPAYARLYYTLRLLGRLDLHRGFFEALDRGMRNGSGQLQTFEQQQAFAAHNGIAAEAFASAYHSESVTLAVERAEDMTRAYRVDHTPTFVIQGKYRTDAHRVAGEGELLKLVDFLLRTQRSR
jgi:protein dithiol oxidoreductase (disulfide-forming)